MDDLQLTVTNPLRPVDARHRIAAACVRSGRYPSPRLHDRATCEIAAYLRARHRSDLASLSRMASARRYVELHQAYELRESAQPRVRAALEAMLVTDLAVDVIAAKFGVTPPVVQWYAAALFDVRDRLAAAHFMVHHVIEQSRQRRPHEWHDYGWKLIAYLAGDTALEQVMGAGPVKSLPELASVLRQETLLALQEKARRLAYALPVDPAGPLAKQLTVVGGAEQKSAEHVPSGIEANIQAMLETIHFEVGERDDPDSPLAEFDHTAVELNGKEMMLTAMGIKLPHLKELAELGFPDPPARSPTK
jgi:hypothetical protein